MVLTIMMMKLEAESLLSYRSFLNRCSERYYIKCKGLITTSNTRGALGIITDSTLVTHVDYYYLNVIFTT